MLHVNGFAEKENRKSQLRARPRRFIKKYIEHIFWQRFKLSSQLINMQQNIFFISLANDCSLRGSFIKLYDFCVYSMNLKTCSIEHICHICF